MIKELRDTAIGFFILVVAFSGSLYGIMLACFGLVHSSIVVHLYYFAIAFGLLLFFIGAANKISLKPFVNTILIGIVVAILYFWAHLHYQSTPIHSYFESNTTFQATHNGYHRYFIYILVHFIPAIAMGAMMLQDSSVLKKMDKALLPFILFFTIVLAYTIFSAKISYSVATTFEYMNDQTLNYQLVSYYSMFAFGMTLYLISNHRYPWIFYILLTALAALQLVLALTAGGRGAFVMGLAFCLYFGLTRLSFGKMTLYILLAGVAFLVVQYLLVNNELFGQGYERIMNFFSNQENYRTDNRWVRWDLSFESFATSPIIGHGIGSVFYEVGYYSHEIFLDILCEGGLVLFGIFAYGLFKFGSLLWSSIKYDRHNELLLVLFLCSFVYLCFSGYYLGESAGWLAVSYVLCRGRNYEKEAVV
ncbi:MAG: O-antigen ligase family protein [Prevotellaceae bacterium]|nr:O-antigen ligase family protein [Prevotellaceae bacterium]